MGPHFSLRFVMGRRAPVTQSLPTLFFLEITRCRFYHRRGAAEARVGVVHWTGRTQQLSTRDANSIPTRLLLNPRKKPKRIERDHLTLSSVAPNPPMASAWCLSAPATAPPVAPAPGSLGVPASASALARVAVPVRSRRRWGALVVCAAPDEEKITRRSPLDFPIVILLPPPSRQLVRCLSACPCGIGCSG
jgi:hypothetical protein